jgi:WD40 repeat protein
VVIWHVTEKRFQKLDGGHSDAVTRISFSPNGQYLASLDNEEKLIIWSTQVLLGQILLSLYNVD